ncbi:arginyltransferase [Paraglaciecola aquimarina]|uniref:Aspartate/glutamate leucyltransferase n=1 Tax=Paraglaciecola algarum TaxID=3050085 RepID=A0ABS9DAV6_9ALTE|nr:arginyltransferase [Paraglaciecola sp. G1-23]MCF2950053.1 arginyltransferase [Paraglaciecola sp. G1-23]
MKFGLTQAFPCSYLTDQQEQLLVLMPDLAPTAEHYDYLIGAGFRRSGLQIYRPHCQACKACEAIRLPVNQFALSKSQKRILNRNKDLIIKVSEQDKPEYYPLYESYINQRHADGSMYPASRQQYDGFILSPWDNALFIEFYAETELIGVAVTDNLPKSLSALYTFFKPTEGKRSLGTYAILQQIDLAKSMNKAFLYLGYQIDACAKMNYKQNFLPHERFFNEKWQLIAKKVG